MREIFSPLQPYISLISAQFVQTWAVASQSILHWRTYWPGVRSGTRTVSTTPTLPQADGWLPEQSPEWPDSSQGGLKAGSGVSSHEVQSLPGVPGQGSHPAPALEFNKCIINSSERIILLLKRNLIPAVTTEASRRNWIHCPHWTFW